MADHQNWCVFSLPLFSFPLCPMKTYVGVDVSKGTLAVAFPTMSDTWKVSSFANSPDGIRRLMSAYHKKLMWSLKRQALTRCFSRICSAKWRLTSQLSILSRSDRWSGHHFGKMQLSVTKTDESDSILLARYGQMTQPPLYEMDGEIMMCLRQKRTLLRQYKNRTAEAAATFTGQSTSLFHSITH